MKIRRVLVSSLVASAIVAGLLATTPAYADCGNWGTGGGCGKAEPTASDPTLAIPTDELNPLEMAIELVYLLVTRPRY